MNNQTLNDQTKANRIKQNKMNENLSILTSNNRKLATNTNKHCGTDNWNPICPGLSYEAPDVMLSVSLLFQRSHCGLLKTIEPPSSFVALYVTLQCSTSRVP
jgi:hypothetical protein